MLAGRHDNADVISLRRLPVNNPNPAMKFESEKGAVAKKGGFDTHSNGSTPSASSRELGRHEDHRTGGRLANLLRGPTERNIHEASFTMTTHDQQIRFEVGRHLHNDVPGI